MTTHIIIDPVKLAKHMKLCLKNLKEKNCFCADCPFEEIILQHYPEHKKLFTTVKNTHYDKPRREGN